MQNVKTVPKENFPKYFELWFHYWNESPKETALNDKFYFYQ